MVEADYLPAPFVGRESDPRYSKKQWRFLWPSVR
jgi:hypothetical protein